MLAKQYEFNTLLAHIENDLWPTRALTLSPMTSPFFWFTFKAWIGFKVMHFLPMTAGGAC
jgi:hypothetical protein